MACPSSWCPRQIPNVGTPELTTVRIASTGPVSVAGSPGPFERKTPSGFAARICSAVDEDGITVTLHPSVVKYLRLLYLTPKSTATT
jgi:hypothetical protein